MNRHLFAAILIITTLSVIATLPAQAVISTNTWTPAGNGVYTNQAQWSPAIVPNNNNGSGTNYVARIDGGLAGTSAVVIEPFLSIALDRLIVSVGDSLTISNGAQLGIGVGAAVTGTVALASDGNYTPIIFSGTQSLLGTGQVLMAGTVPSVNYLRADNGGTLTVGSGITIHGAGQIYGDSANPLVNLGTISADISNQTLAVQYFANPGRVLGVNGGNLSLLGFTNSGTVSVSGGGSLTANTFTNTGTMRISGGTLQLQGPWANSGVISGDVSAIYLGGTFSTAAATNIIHTGGSTITLDGTMVNTNGTFTLNANTGSWFLNSGTIQGGTVNATGGAQLLTQPFIGSGTLDGVTLNANLTVTNGAYYLYVVDGLTNNAVITLASDGNFTAMYCTGPETLAGTGQIHMAGTVPSVDYLYTSGSVTNGAAQTIHGAGQIYGDSGNPLVNLGTISADISNQQLNVQCVVNQGQFNALNGGLFYSATLFTNSGAVTIGNGSTLQFQGDYVQAGGSTLLNGGQLTPIAGGSVLVEGGSLGGGGFVNAVVTNFSSIVPGPAPSALVFSSNLVLNAGSVLNFQFAGAFNSQYGQVVLSNGVNLAGSLAITLINGFVPEPGSSFTVLTSAQPITGGFVNATSGFRIQTLNGAGSFVYVQNTSSIVLGNFQVNSQAYLTWAQSYFGCTNCSQSSEIADPDGDGVNNYDEFASGFNPTKATAYPHIISIVRTNSNTDIRVTYLGANGDSTWTPGFQSRTNVLECATGAADGSYFATTNFVSTGQTNILSGGTGLGIVTNMVDHGGATNQPARYYRVKIIAP